MKVGDDGSEEPEWSGTPGEYGQRINWYCRNQGAFKGLTQVFCIHIMAEFFGVMWEA